MITTFNKTFYRCLLGAFALLPFVACESLDDTITEDPYGGGREPIGIKLLSEAPMPESGYPGDTVVFKAKGLTNLYDEATGDYRFKFYMNEVETPIYSATDSTLTVIVPENISSGLTYIVAENQVFYGPTFTILGNLTIDSNFKLANYNISGPVYDYLEHKYTGTAHNFYIVGEFRRVNNTERVGIAFVNEQGEVGGNKSTYWQIEVGIMDYKTSFNYGSDDSYLKSISYFSDGQMLISGEFATYWHNFKSKLWNAYYVPVNNIAILDKYAVMDTIRHNFYESYNTNPSSWQPLSSFNGGTNVGITKSFVTSDQKVIGVGNFNKYFRSVYRDWYSETEEVTTNITCVFKAERDGSLVETYRNMNDGYTGIIDGQITDAYMDGDDGVVVIGTFSSFDGIPTPGIVRIDKNGDVDRTYLSNIGTGADDNITKIRYSSKFKKTVIAGPFTSFNGQPRNGLAILDKDGNLDENFVPREVSGGTFDFGTLIDVNKVVASGTFRLYDGVPRQGFVVLEPDGEAIQKYNVPGEFSGDLYQVVETETSIGNYGLLLLGEITRFNGKPVNNAVMVEADFSN